MKHFLVAASLVCAVSSQAASAEHAKPLMEINYRSEIAAPTRSVAIYSTGAYTVKTFNADGTAASVVRTGLPNTEFRVVRDALRAAPWDITYSRIMCFAYSPSYTEYRVHDKLVYTAQMCSGASADETTRQAIATIEHAIGLD